MKKTIAFWINLLVFIACAVLLLIQNRVIALSRFGTWIGEHGESVFDFCLNVVFWFEVVLHSYEILLSLSAFLCKTVWKNVHNELEISIECRLKDHSKEDEITLYDECCCLLLSYDKSPSDPVLISKLCEQFEMSDSLQKERIAYLFLAHRSNKSIAEFCSKETGIKFLQQCEGCSKEVLYRTTYDDANLQQCSNMFGHIINEFLHYSLLSNIVNTDEQIDYIRRVLSWVRCELRENHYIENSELQMFLIVLAKFERNLTYHNINDKLINKYIRDIKKSIKFKLMYLMAYCRLWKHENCNENKEHMSDSAFVVAHIWNFGLIYRLVLIGLVLHRLCEYRKNYHIKHKEAVEILVIATPLGAVLSGEQNQTDRILTVISAVGGKK